MRLLPEIDLANIAALPREHRQPALRAFKAGTPRFSYRLVRQAAPDIFNAQSELLGTIPPTDFEQIRRRMQASGGSIQEIKANLEVAESLHAYTTCNTVSAKRYYISPFQLSGAVGIELCYWLPLVLVRSGLLFIPFIDPRRSHRLTEEGRRFAFSMIHEKARTIDPDLADAELAIFQFLPVDHDQRHLKIHVATDVTLFCYEELDTRVAETYADWEIVLAEREQEARRAGGRPGTLI